MPEDPASTKFAAVHVYTQFPIVMPQANSLQNNLDPINWRWTECLVFPVTKLSDLHLSLKPYKWIRYATGAVVGAHGDLYSHCELNSPPEPQPINYDAPFSTQSANLYYHITDDEKCRMFPTDPDIARDSDGATTSTGTSGRRSDFRAEVAERDGMYCVLIPNLPSIACKALHLLPHSKGDMYIETFTRRRSRSDTEIITNIDDVRNGIFLNRITDRGLGRQVEILVTPNFAMDTTDVCTDANPEDPRFTAHSFSAEGAALLLDSAARSGSSIPVPADTSKWPPAEIFEAVYAGVVMKTFGVQKVFSACKEMLYPSGGPMGSVQAVATR